jgi:hypothetical protein
MAKDKNTFAKRQRESLKRQKAVEKQVRRRKRKETPDIANAQSTLGDVAEPL